MPLKLTVEHIILYGRVFKQPYKREILDNPVVAVIRYLRCSIAA